MRESVRHFIADFPNGDILTDWCADKQPDDRSDHNPHDFSDDRSDELAATRFAELDDQDRLHRRRARWRDVPVPKLRESDR